MKIKDQIKNKIGTQDSNGVAVTVKDIPVGDIKIRTNVRTSYDPEKLDELADSIKKYGLLQPISVFKDGDQYYVKTGHRRFLAFLRLYDENSTKYSLIRCIVTDADNIQLVQLIENIQREDLSQAELAKAMTEMHNEGMTYQQIADATGKKEPFIRKLFVGINKINSDEEVKEIVENSNNVTIGDVVETNSLSSEDQKNILREKSENNLSRKELRKKIADKKNGNIHDDSGTSEIPIQKLYIMEANADKMSIVIKLDNLSDFQNFKGDLFKFLNKNKWRQK